MGAGVEWEERGDDEGEAGTGEGPWAAAKGRSGEESGNSLLDILGRSLGIGSVSNRASDHNVVGASMKCLLDVHGPLLIVHRPVLDWSDPGNDDEESRA
jgi:hypothetical protein